MALVILIQPSIDPVTEVDLPVDEGPNMNEQNQTPELDAQILARDYQAPPWNPLLDEKHIRVVHHPYSQCPEERILLSDYNLDRRSPVPKDVCSSEAVRWYKPFKSEADFSFAEYVARVQLSNSDIDEFLRQHRDAWSIGSLISFKNHRRVRATIEKAVRTTTEVMNQLQSQPISI